MEKPKELQPIEEIIEREKYFAEDHEYALKRTKVPNKIRLLKAAIIYHKSIAYHLTQLKNAATLVFILLSVFAKAQPCAVNITTSCHSVCAQGTYKVDTSFCVSFIMTASGANSYTWSINGAVASVGPSVWYYAGAPGSTFYEVTGSVDGPHGCISKDTITIRSVICAHGSPVGLEELFLNALDSERLYFDLAGNRIEKRYNELMVEQVGIHRRKVYVTK